MSQSVSKCLSVSIQAATFPLTSSYLKNNIFFLKLSSKLFEVVFLFINFSKSKLLLIKNRPLDLFSLYTGGKRRCFICSRRIENISILSLLKPAYSLSGIQNRHLKRPLKDDHCTERFFSLSSVCFFFPQINLLFPSQGRSERHVIKVKERASMSSSKKLNIH